jgi:hypothetical protein
MIMRVGPEREVSVRHLLFSLMLTIGIGAPTIAVVPSAQPATAATRAPSAGSLQLFDTEAAAQKHCPKDEVVWLNTRTGIYHEKGMRWYGNTKEGAYVCRKEADAAGDRDTRNGQ